VQTPRICPKRRCPLLASSAETRCGTCGYLFIEWVEPECPRGKWDWLNYSIGILAICAALFGISILLLYAGWYWPEFLHLPGSNRDLATRAVCLMLGVLAVGCALRLLLITLPRELFRATIDIQPTHLQWRERHWYPDQVVPWNLIANIEFRAGERAPAILLDLGKLGNMEIPPRVLARVRSIEDWQLTLLNAWRSGRSMTIEEFKQTRDDKRRALEASVEKLAQGDD